METKAPLSAVSAYNVFKLNCPSRRVFDLIGERWAGLVLLALHGRTQRFSDLRRQIEGVSQKMLTRTLRILERDGLVRREAFPTVPVTVEYSLTPFGDSLCEVIEIVRAWAYANAETWTPHARPTSSNTPARARPRSVRPRTSTLTAPRSRRASRRKQQSQR